MRYSLKIVLFQVNLDNFNMPFKVWAPAVNLS